MHPECDLGHYDRVVFFTGAGISAESGIATYRGSGGIWDQYDWKTMACHSAFMRDPVGVWDWHNKRREMIAACDPNPAHEAIAEFIAKREGLRSMVGKTHIVTQNIDGLHQRAGVDNDHVVELHGSLWRVRYGPRKSRKRVENFDVPFTDIELPQGGYWRPDIVWFGDRLEIGVYERAKMLISQADAFVSIGTSAVVWPAAGLIEETKPGCIMIEVNPMETDASYQFHHHIREPASVAVPRMCGLT